jgi:hypothetical protein
MQTTMRRIALLLHQLSARLLWLVLLPAVHTLLPRKLLQQSLDQLPGAAVSLASTSPLRQCLHCIINYFELQEYFSFIYLFIFVFPDLFLFCNLYALNKIKKI